jgi:hypothetical protein
MKITKMIAQINNKSMNNKTTINKMKKYKLRIKLNKNNNKYYKNGKHNLHSKKGSNKEIIRRRQKDQNIKLIAILMKNSLPIFRNSMQFQTFLKNYYMYVATKAKMLAKESY